MVNGRIIVIALVILMAVIGAAAALFKPVPPAAADIAMNKQVELLGSARLFSKTDLSALEPAALDSLISLLNLGLRLNDSLRIASGKSQNSKAHYELRIEGIKKQLREFTHSEQGSSQ